ncbi:unnamed protein product [Chrysoparadoxa australica]
MFLDGSDLELLSISIDGQPLKKGPDYTLSKEGLELSASAMPDRGVPFTIHSVVAIKPEDNTQLAGLYKSGPMLCTQCEAEGFRRITFFQDRPDVMASFNKVRIEADKADFPVLLSNGNRLEEGDIPGNGRHFAIWQDTFQKPCYLFALVAGDLGRITDSFTTMTGKKVDLNVYSEQKSVDQLAWSMESLKAAMKWDEEKFGREYHLDLFNIVATDFFSMGAMENTGLNIFNTAFVLAKPDTATDDDYERVEGVIGHEYFHNWTGNRVTCRDWFQLTLKEGLTVFRDQQFSADMGSYVIKRIEKVRLLRGRQFLEDAGPLAHPIRPESVISQDNFYTATVYNKGAEVIRMYHTLVGSEGFRKGMDLYFERHDGTAVTCDDFRAAMADANNINLTQFERWYLQAGTPDVYATGVYDPSAKKYSLTLKQSTKPTPKQDSKLPFHIPVRTGLLLRDGTEIAPSQVLELREAEQTFTFDNIPSEPLPSLLRDFSAPVRLHFDYSDEDLAFLMTSDTDSFNRWEAGQQLATRVVMGLTKLAEDGKELPPLPNTFLNSFRRTLMEASVDRSLQAYALALPTFATLTDNMEVINPDALEAAIKHVKTTVAEQLGTELMDVYSSLATPGPYIKSAPEIGKRRLKATCLGYLHQLKNDEVAELCYNQFTNANGMTDKLSALSCLADMTYSTRREEALESFYEDAAGDSLVTNKWFSIQSCANVPDLLSRVKQLIKHPDFDFTNPNRLRSVVAVFATVPKFHTADGSGYEFVADMVLKTDPINSQVAARLTGSFSQWRRFDESRQEHMKHQLQRIKDTKGVSKDVFEVASRCLG